LVSVGHSIVCPSSIYRFGQKIPKRKSKENGQTTIYKTKHKKPKMEQDEFQKGGLNSSAPEGLAVSALYVL
jgi:hypothetical protein